MSIINRCFYHWCYGKMKVVDENSVLTLEIMDIEGVNGELQSYHKNQKLTERKFSRHALEEWLFEDEGAVYKTTLDFSKGGYQFEPHNIYDSEKLVEQNRLFEPFYRYMNIVSDSRGEKEHSILNVYDDIWNLAKEKKINLCHIKEFGDLRYEELDSALHYSYRFMYRYALDSAEFFNKILSKNKHIKRILIVGSGNNADIMGLNYAITDQKAHKYSNFELTTVDPIEWGYYPKIELNKKIKYLNHFVKKFSDLQDSFLLKQDLILFSRVLNEIYTNNREEKTRIAKKVKKLENDMIIGCIYAYGGNKNQDDDYSRLSSWLKVDAIDRCFETKTERRVEEILYKSWDRYITDHCNQQFMYCEEQDDCYARRRITFNPNSRYEILQKEAGTFYDYFG